MPRLAQLALEYLLNVISHMSLPIYRGVKSMISFSRKKKPQKSSGPHLLISLWNLPAHHLRITESIGEKQYATIVTTKMPQCSNVLWKSTMKCVFFPQDNRFYLYSSTGKFSLYPTAKLLFNNEKEFRLNSKSRDLNSKSYFA